MDPTGTVPAQVALTIGGRRIELQLAVPTGPMRPRTLLPLLQSLTDTVVGIATDEVRERGEAISCQAGCGACCRQLVPISATDTRHLRDVVNAPPEPQQSAVKARFADALRRFDEAGLLLRLRGLAPMAKDELRSLGLDYFRVGVACPFLEDESCSVHPDRPLACREYLVTSPAANCARPTAETVQCVELPGKVSNVLAGLETTADAPRGKVVPLVLALEWADA